MNHSPYSNYPTVTQTADRVCFITNKVFQISYLDACKVFETFQKVDYRKNYKYYCSSIADFQVTASGYENLTPGYPVLCWITEKNERHVHTHFTAAKNSKNEAYSSNVYISKRNNHLRIKINKFNFLSYRLCETSTISTNTTEVKNQLVDFQTILKSCSQITTI